MVKILDQITFNNGKHVAVLCYDRIENTHKVEFYNCFDGFLISIRLNQSEKESLHHALLKDDLTGIRKIVGIKF